MLKKLLVLALMTGTLATGVFALSWPGTTTEFRHPTIEQCIEWRMQTMNMDYQTAYEICCPKYYTHC